MTNFWKEIIGHEREKTELQRAIDSGGMPHAYIFSGIDGIGKKLTAYAVASALLNIAIKEGSLHPDFIEIKSDGEQILIEQIRDLKDKLKFQPLNGKCRIIIIDQSETMNKNAQNAALKILEEPPAGNYFFLITHAYHEFLPTIISRCRLLQFSPLTFSQIESFLKERMNFDPESARLAAGVGEGSIARALSVNAELIAEVTDDLRGMISNRTASEILEKSEKYGSNKENIDKILYIIHRCYHNALVSCDGSGTEMSDVSRLIARKWSPRELSEKCGMIAKTHTYIAKTYNKQLMFEQLLFSLTA